MYTLTSKWTLFFSISKQQVVRPLLLKQTAVYNISLSGKLFQEKTYVLSQTKYAQQFCYTNYLAIIELFVLTWLNGYPPRN